jgi:N-hydroxyarylamine O-acetyltransferase
MIMTLDLDAYFDRIGWGNGTLPTYETLAGILDAHMRYIPFENVDVLLGRTIHLDLNSLQQKLVLARRGGYCFEHGTLFNAVLNKIGFRPTAHTARVVLFTPREAAPRTHMFLTVPVGNSVFVVDPGFGGLAPQVPVPLSDRAVSAEHWMVRDGPYWVLRVQTEDGVVDAWVSTLDVDNMVDFEMGSYFVSTHPNSPFVNRLMLRALTPTGRITVMNQEVTAWHDKKPYRSFLSSRKALRELLREHFGFDLVEVETLKVPSIPDWSS